MEQRLPSCPNLSMAPINVLIDHAGCPDLETWSDKNNQMIAAELGGGRLLFWAQVGYI